MTLRRDDMTTSDIAHRSETAVAAVLPQSVRIRRARKDGHSLDLELNGEPIRVTWLGEGGLRQARELIASQEHRPDVAVARLMSSGAREALSAAGIGWVDETGAAEIVRGSMIVSRSGRPPEISAQTATLDTCGPGRRRSLTVRRTSNRQRHAGNDRVIRRKRN